MAVLRITESQYKAIRLHEANNSLHDLINQEYAMEIANVGVGDFVHLTFGKLDENDEIEEDTKTIATLVVKEVDKDYLTTTFLGAKGAFNPFEKDQTVFIPKRNAIDPIKGFINVNKLEGDKTKSINIPNFLGFMFNKTLEGGQLDPEELETMIKTTSDVVDTKWDNFKGRAVGVKTWEPGFLGMDNAFFFPTGFMAADDILSKYGIFGGEDVGGTQVKFRLKGNSIIAGQHALKSGAVYSGQLKPNNEIIVKGREINFVLKVDEREQIARGGNYLVKSTFKFMDKATGRPQEKTVESSINIISIK